MSDASASTSNVKPLVTFALLAYNQEAYVRKAVIAALNQTYSNLEILISDDASTDRTAEILREEVERYGGPHRVILNVNAKNLGIGSHVNRLFELASGALVILAAGDDVSYPDRAERMAACWLANERRSSAIYCEARAIDGADRPIGRFNTSLAGMNRSAESIISYDSPGRLLLLGACAAYTKEVYSHFGPLLPELPVEDIPLTVRAGLLGGVHCIRDELVDYRVNVSVWLPRKIDGEDFERHVRRMAFRLRANWLVSTQIALDVDGCSDDAARGAARHRLTASEFAWRTCRDKRFSLFRYVQTGLRSGYWRSALFPAALIANPRLHRWLFKLKNRVRQRRN